MIFCGLISGVKLCSIHRSSIGFNRDAFWFVTIAFASSLIYKLNWHWAAAEGEAESIGWWNCKIITCTASHVCCRNFFFSIHRVLNRLLTCGFHKRYEKKLFLFRKRNPLNLSFLRCVDGWATVPRRQGKSRMQYGIYIMKECMKILIKHINFPVFPVLRPNTIARSEFRFLLRRCVVWKQSFNAPHEIKLLTVDDWNMRGGFSTIIKVKTKKTDKDRLASLPWKVSTNFLYFFLI